MANSKPSNIECIAPERAKFMNPSQFPSYTIPITITVLVSCVLFTVLSLVWFFKEKNNYPRLRIRKLSWIATICMSLIMNLFGTIIPLVVGIDRSPCFQTFAFSIISVICITAPTMLRIRYFALSTELSLVLSKIKGEDLQNFSEIKRRIERKNNIRFFLGYVIPISAGFAFLFWRTYDLLPLVCTGCAFTQDYVGIVFVICGYVATIGIFGSWKLRKANDIFGLLIELRLALVLSTPVALAGMLVNSFDPNNIHTNGVLPGWWFVAIANAIFIAVSVPYQVYLAKREGEIVVKTDFISRLINRFTKKSLDSDTRQSKKKLTQISSGSSDPATFDLTSILDDHEGVRLFNEYLISEFCVELIKFHLEVENMKARWYGITPDAREEMALNIYKNFIIAGSPLQINIGQVLRDQISRKFTTSSQNALPRKSYLTRATILGKTQQNQQDSNVIVAVDPNQEAKKEPINLTVFDDADVEVLRLLKAGPFLRFQKTKAYQSFVTSKRTLQTMVSHQSFARRVSVTLGSALSASRLHLTNSMHSKHPSTATNKVEKRRPTLDDNAVVVVGDDDLKDIT